MTPRVRFIIVQSCTLTRAVFGLALIVAMPHIPTRVALEITVLVLILGIGLDALDGFLARRWRVVSQLGAALDPTVDALFYFSIAGNLYIAGIISHWIPVLIFLRSLVAITLRLILCHYGQDCGATKLGKIKTGIVACCLTIIASVDYYRGAIPHALELIFIFAIALSSCISIIDLIIRRFVFPTKSKYLPNVKPNWKKGR